MLYVGLVACIRVRFRLSVLRCFSHATSTEMSSLHVFTQVEAVPSEDFVNGQGKKEVKNMKERR